MLASAIQASYSHYTLVLAADEKDNAAFPLTGTLLVVDHQLRVTFLRRRCRLMKYTDVVFRDKDSLEVKVWRFHAQPDLD